MNLKQRLNRADDSGAALVIALIFVTVVAVAIAGVLSYADANVRATVALRNQAQTVAAAESAADLAINTLRKSVYTGSGDCLDAATLTALSNLNPPMTVSCDKDTTNSVTGTTGSPSGYALRTLQSNSALEDAVYVKANGSGTGINIAGDVGSASNIDMDHGDMVVTGTITAKSCLGTITATVAKNCSASAPNVGDPGYAAPDAPTVAGSISPCSGTKRTFQPGLYTNLSILNQAWSSCPSATVYDFRPGIYYFSFSGVWTIDKGTTIGGASSALGTTPPSIPGACPNPLTGGSSAGVTFVFGGEAQLLITDTAKVEICGRRPAAGSSDPSMAFYGLKAGIGSGSFAVPAQNGCIVRTSGSRCAAITTDNHSDGVRFYFQGHLYMPLAKIDLDLRKSSDQYLNGGVTVRAFSLFSPASGVIPTPLSSGPVQEPQDGRTIVFLTVYVCSTSPCNAASGKTKLKVKVGFADVGGPAVAGPRGVTIYNWSVVR